MLFCSHNTKPYCVRAPPFGDDDPGMSTPRFWHYMGVRILLDLLKASSLVLFEGAVMAIIKQHGGDIGLQKLFSTVGGLIFGPLAGAIVDLSRLVFYPAPEFYCPEPLRTFDVRFFEM